MVTEGDVEWEGVGRATAIVYWRKPEEWANAIYEWVIVSACFWRGWEGVDDRDGQIDNTGQKGSVLTLYEISEGDLTRNQGILPICSLTPHHTNSSSDTEFHTIDPYVLRKALDFLVKRSLAQVFGTNEEMGVKFF